MSTAEVQALASKLEPWLVVAMVVVFVLTFLSLYWPGRKQTVEQPGLIPFKDDE